MPPEGIKVFGNFLHTHLAGKLYVGLGNIKIPVLNTGHGLVVKHFRETECGQREELKPIDENRRYDFDYQQFTILPQTKTVFPVGDNKIKLYMFSSIIESCALQGDEILLQCFYRTSGYTGVTLVSTADPLTSSHD